MNQKPLGRKAYGSIGHLPGSRLGPSDHHVHAGQDVICLTGRTTKGERRRVIVQTKLDGSCVAAAKLPTGEIVALGRAGHLASTSPHSQHHLWAEYVADREDIFREVLRPGERLVGEWLALAHGTVYEGLAEPFRPPFVAFDIMSGTDRLTFDKFYDRVCGRFMVPDTREGPLSVEEALAQLDDYGAVGGHEGVVYRVERGDRVDFLAKFVKADKVDGIYLDGPEVWNWRPEPRPVESSSSGEGGDQWPEATGASAAEREEVSPSEPALLVAEAPEGTQPPGLSDGDER